MPIRMLSVLTAVLFTALSLYAQEPDSTRRSDTAVEQEPTRVFYGGTLGLSFGSYFRISVQPMLGYQFTPKVSGGVKVVYEYIKDTRSTATVTAHNYGGSVFGRYRFIPQAYAHAEFAYMSYKYSVTDYSTERSWVPFLFLGGGYIQKISPSTSFFVEVLFDVLQNSKSPYEDWTPFISVGVAVGF